MPIKPRKRKKLTREDISIFSTVNRAKRPLSVKKISERTHLSWPTANLHVKKLKRMNVLNTKKTPRKTNVFVNEDFLAKIKKKRKKGLF